MAMISDNTIIYTMLVGVVAISIALNLFQHAKISSQRSSIGGEFGSIVKNAKAQGAPVCIMVDKGSRGIPFVGVVSETNDAMLESPKTKKRVYKNTKFNLVAPQAAQANHQIDLKGVGSVSIFANPYHFPFNIHSSAALCALGQLIEKDPVLGKFRNTPKILELCFNRTGTFRLECIKYMRTSVEFNLENGPSVEIPFKPRTRAIAAPEEDDLDGI